ncbi:hypothetical protein ABT160_09155 [Streptomyces sp. NPDC001941]|uniref:hypothetical protein n=1 Tax=Streptomyces sp. NPDC001941 TaxID=3154659 RepID=UPI0033172DE0
MMTVLVVADDAPAAVLRGWVERGPHFRMISHAPDPDLALARARVLLPDITLIDTAPALRDSARHLFHEVRALHPPSAVIWHAYDTQLHDERLRAVLEEGAVHAVRKGDHAELARALAAIGRRRASCDPDLAH